MRKAFEIGGFVAAAILIAQTAVIAVLLNQHTETLRPLSGPAAGQGPLLQVQLRPSATEEQVRELLNAADAQIVAGPGALGIYTIRVADADATRALQRLRAADRIVESVSPLPR